MVSTLRRTSALAGAGAMGLAGGANGAVQFFDVPDVNGASIYFDMESAMTSTATFGTADYFLSASVTEGYDYYTKQPKTKESYDLGYTGNQAGGAMYGSGGLARLTEGAAINSSGGYGPGSMYYSSSPSSYEWTNTDPGNRGFLGLMFDISGATHYGWAEVQLNQDNTLTLYRYAYEDVAGNSINAGSVVPEPSTLGLLMTGAAGAACVRRRRK